MLITDRYNTWNNGNKCSNLFLLLRDNKTLFWKTYKPGRFHLPSHDLMFVCLSVEAHEWEQVMKTVCLHVCSHLKSCFNIDVYSEEVLHLDWFCLLRFQIITIVQTRPFICLFSKSITIPKSSTRPDSLARFRCWQVPKTFLIFIRSNWVFRVDFQFPLFSLSIFSSHL